MNKLLQRQLQKHFGKADQVPENFVKLLNVISESYDHYEKDRRMMERSIELSSKEMIELNTQIKKSGKDEFQKVDSQLKTLLENIEEIMYSVDMVSLRILQISAACEKVYGYTQTEFLADRDLWQKVILLEDIPIVDRYIKALYEGKQVVGHYRIIHKNKTIRWLESKIIPVLDEAGQLIRIDGVTTDISERKLAEKLIKESELRYRSLIEQATDAICIADRYMKFIDINPSGCALLGYSKEEFLQLTVIDVLPMEDMKTNPIKIEELKSGKTIRNERKVIRKDGTIADAEVSGKILEDGRFIIFGRDISERKQAEKLIMESELRYRSLIEQATDAICIADSAMKFVDINPSGCEMLGYSKEEFIQLFVADILPAEDIKANPFKIEELKSGKTVRNERRIIRKDGTIADLELSGKILEDGRLIVFGQDISERKKTEKLLKESELRYRNLIEQATDAICIADSAMKFIDVNRYACEFLGYSKEEALQLFVTDVLFTEDFASNPFKFDDVQPGEIIRNERRFKRKDGTSVIMEVSTRLTEDGRFIMFGHDVSDRKKSEEALRESEKRLRQIIDLVPHFIFAKDAKGKFILANEAVAAAYGCTVENLIGKSDADFNSKKEEIEHFMQEDLKVINSGNVKYNIEETITNASGNTRMLSTTKIPYTSPGLTTPGVLGVSVDITEHKKAEAVLKESEGQLSVASQIAKLGYWEFDVAKNQFTFNDQVYSIFKTTAEEMGGYNMSSEVYLRHFVYPDDYSIVTKVAAEAIKSPDPDYSRQIEHRIKYADGRIGYMATRFYVVKNELGRTIKTFGAIQDITEKKNSEADLIKRDNQLTIATQIAKLGYWEYDVPNDRFTFNDQFYSIFKTTAEKVGGYTMTAARYAELFVHPDERKIVGKSVEDAINSDDSSFSFKAEHRIIYADGEIGYISVHFYIAKDNEGHTIKTFGVNQDITERKKGEETLRRSEISLEIKNKQLEQKNIELEQFAYVASHDMQEPLRTTSSFVELLQQQYKGKLDGKADKYLTYIHQASDRMKVLIKDLLDYSRIGRQKQYQEVDCTQTLDEVLADLGKAVSEANVKIRSTPLPVIIGYSTEIKQLFQNLIMNAIKFSKKNIAPEIDICVQEKIHYWEFLFKDNGIGIDEQYKERIFIIFQRLHNRSEYEGSGIGLAHCKKIVEMHGGKIWVESESGQGATFYFTIPKQSNNTSIRKQIE